MGKTGTVNWMQVKGVKGQIRLVPQKDAEVKKPGRTSGSSPAPRSVSSPAAPTRRCRGAPGRAWRTGPRRARPDEGPAAPSPDPALQGLHDGRQAEGQEITHPNRPCTHSFFHPVP